MEKSKKYLIISSIIVLVYSSLFYSIFVDLRQVSFLKGLVIPLIGTFVVVMGAFISLIRYTKPDYGKALARGYFIGLIVYVLLAIVGTTIGALIHPMLWIMWADLVNLPGGIVAKSIGYSSLRYFKPNQLIIETHEPFIAWTILTFSLLTWAGTGSLRAFIKHGRKIKE